MLILARKVDERIIIGGDIEISVIDIRGDQVKLGISAPSHIKVYRQEVYEAILEENRRAATARGIPAELEAFFAAKPAGKASLAPGDTSTAGSESTHPDSDR